MITAVSGINKNSYCEFTIPQSCYKDPDMIKFRAKFAPIADDDPEAAEPNAYIAATSALPLGN